MRCQRVKGIQVFGVVLLLVFASAATPVVGFPPTVESATQPELLLPKPRIRINPDRDYWGKVTAVGKDSFVFGPGWEASKYPNEVGPDDTAKPRRFRVTGALAGGDPEEYREPLSYHLRDLQAGDMLQIISGVTKTGEEYALFIVILRRPGGKIPRLPEEGDTPLRTTEVHLRHQAEQDWEEKGVPIPKRFLSKGRAPWTKPPYPPVAPQPREVKK